jgi:hypothetical protein
MFKWTFGTQYCHGLDFVLCRHDVDGAGTQDLDENENAANPTVGRFKHGHD